MTADSHLSREFETEKAVSALLKTSLLECSINEQLHEILNILANISWLNVYPQGAIFLANGSNELVMSAQYNLSPELRSLCSRIKIGTCLCGLAAERREILFTNCIDGNHTITFESMKPHGHYNIPLIKDDNLLGVIVLYVPHGHVQQENEEVFIEMIGDTVASIVSKKILEERVKIIHYEVEESRSETMSRLLAASEFRDTETGMHIKRMTEYAVAIGRQLGLPGRSLSLLRQGAPMHDIGKIGIPDAILLKNGPLTKDEFEVMKTHTRIGAELLKGVSEYLHAAREIALSHHERWDGSGYPNGLRGGEIPLFGRICAIADVFDALTSNRPYKQKWPIKKAFEYIADNAGVQFDPELVESFFAARGEILRINAIYQDEIIESDNILHADHGDGGGGWMAWDESLSVGIDVIDSQHKYLINLTNDVYSKTMSNEGASVVIPAIKQMMEYSDIHFSQEEKIMREVGYPDLERHKEQHRGFVEKQNYFRECIKSHPLVVSNEISFFLRDWLTRHIKMEDTRIRDYVTS